MLPRVSVVMSVYNSERYVEDAVSSILDQTYRAFEFIIINDGSTDGSGGILERFARRDSRIHFISREHRGLVHSLNESIRRASGDWVARMDADDVSMPDRIERQLSWIEKTGAEVCGTSVRVIGTGFSRVWRYCESDEGIKTHLLFNSAFAHPTVMIRTSLIQRYEYDPSFSYAQDYELWTRMAADGVRMTNCPDVLLAYRLHESQITNRKRTAQFETRNQCARRYWTSFGVELPVNSLERFQHVDEARRLMESLLRIRTARQQPSIAAREIWAIALRSCDLGLQLWRTLRNIPFFRAGLFRSGLLFLLCLIRMRSSGRLYELMYKYR